MTEVKVEDVGDTKAKTEADTTGGVEDVVPGVVVSDAPPTTGEDGAVEEEDEELAALKRKVKEMQAEAEMLAKMQDEAERAVGGSASAVGRGRGAGRGAGGGAATTDVDARSVYVGSVDYAATPEELQTHFASCGAINRITILCDKWTGKPKGYAYVEFNEADSVANAVLLNETTFRGRQLKVTPKRTNIAGYGGRGRGRGYGGRGYGGRGYGRGRGRRSYHQPY